MTRKSCILTGLFCSGVLLGASGCSLITAQTVGSAVATHVGKKVIEDMKEKHDEEKAQEDQQTAQARPTD